MVFTRKTIFKKYATSFIVHFVQLCQSSSYKGLAVSSLFAERLILIKCKENRKMDDCSFQCSEHRVIQITEIVS